MTERRPKVLLVGDYGPGQLALSYERGFREAGADVVRFETGQSRVFGLPVNRLTRPALGRSLRLRKQEALINAAVSSRPDLVFVLKGEWLDERALSELRSRVPAALANYYPDDPFSAPDVGASLWRALPRYDRVYVFSHAFAPRLAALGAKPSYLPFAWDPAMHPHVPPREDARLVSFVGNWWSDREAWLSALLDFDLGLWGNWSGLARRSPLRKRVRGPAVYEQGMSDVLGTSAIVLNFIRIVANGHNMRSYEAPGAGAFLLSNRTPELGELFREGEEIACFDSPTELRDKVDFFLRNPDERLRIAAAGHLRCQQETYGRRAAAVLRDLTS